MSDTKQVIVVRRDLNMSPGKACAQVAHAAMAFLTKNGVITFNKKRGIVQFQNSAACYSVYGDEIEHWINGSFTKICVYVDSEEELNQVYENALENGLITHSIIDNGKTEFNNIPTLTCVAIGPHWNNRFEGITDHLKTK